MHTAGRDYVRDDSDQQFAVSCSRIMLKCFVTDEILFLWAF
jgi:hypothetical protein